MEGQGAAAPTSSPAGPARPLRILAYLSHAWPVQRGGSEVATHRVLRWLANRGHDVRAAVVWQRGYVTDGVAYASRTPAEIDALWAWADVTLTQQGATDQAALYAAEHRTPLAFYVHNRMNLPDKRPLLDPDRDVVIFNTATLAASQADLWPGRTVTVRPPVDPAEFSGTPGDRITQVNLSALKGGPLFWQVARARPDDRFLAVAGGWGEQVAADGRTVWAQKARTVEVLADAAPPNVRVIGTTTTMRTDVYRHTRVLLVPTGRVSPDQVGESYGLVAAEAICAGIPILARPSPGMTELLGPAAVWLDTTKVAAWVDALDALDDPATYAAQSAAATARAATLDPTAELETLETALLTATRP